MTGIPNSRQEPTNRAPMKPAAPVIIIGRFTFIPEDWLMTVIFQLELDVLDAEEGTCF